MFLPRYRWTALCVLAVALGCGPTLVDETDSDSATVGEDGSDGDPASPCGVDDTNLVGGGSPGPTGFPLPCSPLADPGVNGYRCCSDDPAAVSGAKPDYEGRGIADAGEPLFSEGRNDASRFGQCFRVGDIAGQGLSGAGAEHCPIPCNPTWSAAWIEDVCGAARVCCQTVELQPEDCILDADTGLFRPIRGTDIGPEYLWRPGDHMTHQDPNGNLCLEFAENSSGEVFEDCVRQLSVADQRGFCMALMAGQTCPLESPTYVDACERLNGG